MTRRRDDVATATVGLAGVAGAGALRNEALSRSYRERGPHPIPRPVVLAERRLIKKPRGRNIYLAGAGLAALSAPAAAVGTTRAFRKADDDSFLRAGVRGARAAAFDRTKTVQEKAPARLVAGNYAAGAGVALGAGSLTHLALHRRVSGNPRHALASTVGALAGTASLPLQSRLTQRASRGQYVTTPTGVRRAKQKPARPSSKASVYDGRGGNLSQFRAQTQVGKAARPRRLPPKGKLTPTGQIGDSLFTGSTEDQRLAIEAARVRNAQNRAKAAEMRRKAFGKRSLDPGAGMSRGERRARYAAAGPPIPIIGDILQARTAGKYAAAPYKRRSMVENYVGGQAGSVAGMGAGTAGALTAASRSKGFDRRAQQANDRIDGFKTNIRTKAGMKPGGQTLTNRALAHPRTPARVKQGAAAIASSSAGRAVARNPKVAAVGALAGGLAGGQVGQQLTYGHTMTRDDRYRAKLRKADAARPMTQTEVRALRRKKNQAAALSLASGATGLGALAATTGAMAMKRPRVAAATRRAGFSPKKVRSGLNRAAVPLLTAGAGVGGYNSLNYAAIQHREARSVGKAFGMPRPRVLGIRRAPAMRRGFIRQTRLSNGMTRVSSVRGGLA